MIPASADDALDMLESALGFLAGLDPVDLPEAMVSRTLRMLERADATGTLCMERMTSPPFGLLGGAAGAAAVVTLTTPDGATRHLPSKGAFAAPAGAIVDMITPGSGGFGPADIISHGRDARVAVSPLDGRQSPRASLRR